MSDLAERLGLRQADELENAISAAGLRVITQMSIKPSHPKATDTDDALHQARADEITSLWRLAVA
jgi:hypothetical protein